MKECKNTLARLEAEQTFSDIFSILCDYGDRICTEYSTPDGGISKFTYKEETSRYLAVGEALKPMLEGKNGFVGLKFENTPDWPALYWAILMNGCSPLLLDNSAEAYITANLLKEAGAVAIITEDPAEYEIKKINPRDVLNKRSSGNFTPVWGKYTALCTSGTTGMAKIYAYDEKAFCAQILSTHEILDTDETQNIMYDYKSGSLKQLVFLPLHHIFGFMAVYMWFTFFGKTMVYLRDKNPQTILETCRNHHVTHLFAVPLLWNNIAQGVNRKMAMADEKTKAKLEKGIAKSLKYQNKSGKAGERHRATVAKKFASVHESLLGTDIRFLISGGGHIIPETMKTLTSIAMPIHNGFGMTETGITSVDLSGGCKERLNGSVGKPFSCCSYKISENGELAISGKSIFSARLSGGKLIPREEEWYCTGDYARLDEDGRLFIEGRLKDVIINESGENIYPDELEDSFTGLIGVKQYCILGTDTGKPYEEITLVADVENNGAAAMATLADAINEANLQLPLFKQVRKVFIADQPMPLANGIKVKRQTLKKLIEDETFKSATLDLRKKRLLSNDGSELGESFKENSDPRFKQLVKEVKTVFADILILPEDQIGDHAHFVTELGGDSLSAVGIITQLEDKYGISVPDSDITKAINVYETAQLIYEILYEGK